MCEFFRIILNLNSPKSLLIVRKRESNRHTVFEGRNADKYFGVVLDANRFYEELFNGLNKLKKKSMKRLAEIKIEKKFSKKK